MEFLTIVGLLSKNFQQNKFSWRDGRYVLGSDSNSPRRADPRLLAIPPSYSRVAENNLN
jgi:hypothetical protein